MMEEEEVVLEAPKKKKNVNTNQLKPTFDNGLDMLSSDEYIRVSKWCAYIWIHSKFYTVFYSFLFLIACLLFLVIVTSRDMLLIVTSSSLYCIDALGPLSSPVHVRNTQHITAVTDRQGHRHPAIHLLLHPLHHRPHRAHSGVLGRW